MTPNYSQTADSPASYGFTITPSDSADLPRATRAVRAATGGVIKWRNLFTDDIQHTTVADGERVPICARRIMATDTTATGLEGLA